jgi:hypothetical protein
MVTTDTIARNVMSAEGRNTTHDYLRYLNYANLGLKELTYDVLGETKVVLLPIDSSLRIDLPSGFIDYTFVGVLGNDGYVHPLGSRGDIPKYGTGNLLAVPDNALFSQFGGVFGQGGGQNQNGYYQPQIDMDNMQMIFSAKYAGDVIYLEYISDGRVSGNNTVVPEYAEEALMAYVYWNSIKRRRGVPQNEKYEAKREYYNQKRLARARTCSFTKQEALQTIRKGFKQAPKA